jgi:hypothetical protein
MKLRITAMVATFLAFSLSGATHAAPGGGNDGPSHEDRESCKTNPHGPYCQTHQ